MFMFIYLVYIDMCFYSCVFIYENMYVYEYEGLRVYVYEYECFRVYASEYRCVRMCMYARFACAKNRQRRACAHHPTHLPRFTLFVHSLNPAPRLHSSCKFENELKLMKTPTS